jgi:hypothetical protein
MRFWPAAPDFVVIDAGSFGPDHLGRIIWAGSLGLARFGWLD